MDSKEASSMATLSKEDDGDVSMTAREASAAFRSGRFDECSDLLTQLLLKKDSNPKVLHNVAILSYFKDGCSDPKKLLEVLESIKKRSDELAYASGEHAESVSNMGSEAALAIKGSNCLPHQFSSSSNSHIGCGDEYDTSLTMFNMAVILFSLHDYVRAYSILDSLYQKIEPMDEATALRVCLLFLDVALISHDPWRFLDVLNYVEKAFCVSTPSSQGDSGGSVQGSSSLMTKSSSLPSNTAVPDASNSEFVANTNASEGALSRTLSEENLETLISTIDMSTQNPTRPYILQSSSDYLRTPIDEFISASDLRLKLQLYKLQCLLLTRNLKAAKRELKPAMSMNLACGKDSSVALLLKSQYEYDRGNYTKAIKLLMASSNRNEIGMSIIHNNNLGCIYHRLGKYHTSSIFFSRALSSTSSLRKEKPLKLSTMSQDKSLEIVYNCGVQHLACGKPILAARCFHKSSLVSYNRPILWLRIAECCLMALDKGLLSSGDTQKDGSEVKVHVIGEGKWRQLAMETGGFGGKTEFVLSDDKQPKLSLSMARQCLLNALYLLDSLESKPISSFSPHGSILDENEMIDASSENSNHKNVAGGDSKTLNLKVSSGQLNSTGDDGKEQKSENNPNTALLNSIVDFDGIRRRENHMLRQTLLADLAFVELELGNPEKALSSARSLLELKECSRIYKFLGNVYAAESLCLLNRPKEAFEHWLAYLSGESKIEIPYDEEDWEKWRVVKTLDSEDQIVRNSSPDELQDVGLLKPEQARGTLCINLAIVFALEGNMLQAHRLAVEGLSTLPNSREAIITAIFVDLAMGNTQEARAKLKQCSNIRFLPSNQTLRSSF